MSDTNQRKVAEALFEHKRSEAEINDALRQEHARREPAIKNTYRLRNLRLSQDGSSKTK
jgi:hypothetical protein